MGPVKEDTAVHFDTVHANIGGLFDLQTSRMVVKFNGTYFVTAHLLTQNEQDVYAWIMVNGKHRVPLHGDGRVGYGSASQAVLLQLTSGEEAWLQLSRDSAILNDYSTMTGWLVYEDD